ncbi:MAG: hypothetical protein SNH63_00740 [Rikenellaceae bacterium]
MIKRLLSIFCLSAVAFLCCGGVAIAQQGDSARFEPRLRAWLSSDSVAIGDIVDLVIEVEKDVAQVVAFPDFDFSNSVDMGQPQLELVGEPRYDTLSAEGRLMTLRRSYRLRSFDEGVYNMGHMSVLLAERNSIDTLHSPDELKLLVTTFMIDSTAQGVIDFKPVQDLPFKFGEISGYVMWGVLALLLLLALAYGALRLMAHYGRPVMGLFSDLPPLPPHVEAFKELERLYDEKLWQVGEYKSYYSRLTDILRNYILRRYGVSAVSMSTDEIIAALRELDLPTRCEMDMQALLRDADLVKFAKAEISASENEAYFGAARDFVEQTRERDAEEMDAEESEQGQAEVKTAESQTKKEEAK